MGAYQLKYTTTNTVYVMISNLRYVSFEELCHNFIRIDNRHTRIHSSAFRRTGE